jgi:hypothetical protein
MGFSCQPPVPALLPDPPVPPKQPAEDRYFIVAEGSLSDLAEVVNNKMRDGWVPTGGGVSFKRYEYEETRYDDAEWVWAQAMVKP